MTNFLSLSSTKQQTLKAAIAFSSHNEEEATKATSVAMLLETLDLDACLNSKSPWVNTPVEWCCGVLPEGA